MITHSRSWSAITVLAFATLMVIVLITGVARAAGPWYVAPGGSDGNSCLSAGSPCATINGAIGKASSDDTIYVATGTYTSTTGSEVVLIDKDITLSGGWDPAFATQSGMSTIDGSGSRRGITVYVGVTAIIERFTVQNGFIDVGAGISNYGTLTLINSTVSRNRASNSSPSGGGISNGGTMILNNSTVSGNTAPFDGGGIFNWGTLSLNNSTVSDNTSGGISNGGTLTLNNSTVSGNTSQAGGGGIANYGTLTLNNSTVSGNTSQAGGGIYIADGTLTLQNSILAGNTASVTGPDCNGSIGSSGYNLIGNTSGCTFTPGTGDLTNINADLGQLIGSPGYHPLLSGSPAINAGNPAGCTDNLGNPLNTDQRGALRVGRCDIGAYEYTSPGPAASISAFAGTPQYAPPSTAFAIPLQAWVLDSIGSPVVSATVTFTAPASGASGAFADSGTYTTTAVTIESGIATAATFTANELSGTYSVTATVGGVVTPAIFLLSNTVVWYVAPTGSDGNTCLSPAVTCATINGAIGKASSDDTIYVATGTYTNSTGSEVVLIDKDTTLSGGWDPAFATQGGMSTIDGEGARSGINVNSGTAAIIERFIVQNGLGYVGGGVFNNGGTLTLNNSSIHHNTAWSAIHNYQGTLILNNSSIHHNTAGNAVINDQGPLILNNSTVSSNTGQGILNMGTLTLNSSTVTSNVGDGVGGIYNSGTTTLRNTIIAGNRSAQKIPDCGGYALTSAGYNLIGDTTGCSFTPGTGDLINVNPKIGPLLGMPGYHPLAPDSPAIDAGNPAGCLGSAGLLTTDQRGAARVGNCDIGAYEYTIPGPAASIAAISGTPQTAPPLFAFNTPLQAVVLDGIGTPVNNVTVIFSAPASGASGIFANSGTYSMTATTDGFGIATASMFTANGIKGSYTVTATVGGIITPAIFSLANLAWYVMPTGNNANDCLTPATACATINGALVKGYFIAGDTVLIGTGMYTSSTGSEVVLIDKNVTLSGGWDVAFTTQSGASIIDGQEARRDVTVDSSVTAIVEHFVLQNGSAGDGGGVVNIGTLTLNDSTVSGNSGGAPGSGFGGGGGIFNWGTLSLNNSTVSGNTVLGDYSGGGIFNGGMLTLNNSTISGNTAETGGGIHNDNYCDVTLNNSTVSGNTADFGGGISNTVNCTVTLNNSTVSNNTAYSVGGISNTSGTVTLQNSILAANTTSGTGPDCSGTLTSQGYNLIQNTSDCTITGDTTGNLTGVDPLLSPLQDNGGPTLTHALLSGSPAIDAGNPAAPGSGGNACEATDQRGVARPQRTACDMGAFELEPTVAFSSNAFSVSEDAGTATITVTLDAVSALTVTVDYSTSDGTALVGSDYLTATGTLTFTPGVMTQTFTVSVINDLLIEGNETVTLTLSNPINIVLGTPNPATLTLVDDEPLPTVQFNQSVFNVDENAGTATITVTLDAVSALTVTVDYSTSDGTATAGSDYVPATGTLTFPPGVMTQTFSVTITDDALDEADETITLTLSNFVNAIPGVPVSATLTIVDNEFKVYLPLILK